MKSFICSIICSNGIVGGTLYADSNYITYKTNKLTVDRRLKNLSISVNQICNISWKWVILPILTLTTISGESYKFLMFNKKGFEKYFNDVKKI